MLIIILSMVCLSIILWISWRVLWALRRYAYRPITVRQSELPSVSVCIAARNEMHALAQCLDYVLTTKYEKLEVLVLDDSSGDDTSRIIQSYAHAGVRFIPGKELPSAWLGKNHAYQTLAEEASGDFILYLDVDTLLTPDTISQLIHQLMANHKTMLSVMPRREDASRASAIFSTLRYVWELVYASRMNPPSASALWLINRKALLSLERGLSDYGLSVRPERHIARQLQREKEYYFVIGTKELGVRYEKHWHSHVETAERLYYPIFGHNITSILFGIAVTASLFIIPFACLIIGFDSIIAGNYMSLFGLLINLVWFGFFTYRTMSTRGLLLRLFAWPYIATQELILYLDSCVRYATGTLRWKGRALKAQPNKHDHYVINE